MFRYCIKSIDKFGKGVTRLRDILLEKEKIEEDLEQGIEQNVVSKGGVRVDIVF